MILPPKMIKCDVFNLHIFPTRFLIFLDFGHFYVPSRNCDSINKHQLKTKSISIKGPKRFSYLHIKQIFVNVFWSKKGLHNSAPLKVIILTQQIPKGIFFTIRDCCGVSASSYKRSAQQPSGDNFEKKNNLQNQECHFLKMACYPSFLHSF